MKKRGASEAELPLNERARRATMALVASLGEVISLFDDAAAGRSAPVPLASSLADAAFAMLGRAGAVVRPELVAHIEQTWLPDDIVRYIFEFALGRREMSRVGAGGRATNPPTNLVQSQFGRPASIRALRLVCKKWSGIASSCVVRIKPNHRKRFDAAHFAALFPNVAHVEMGGAFEKRVLLDADSLIEHYMKRENKPLYVACSAHTPVKSVHGAFCQARLSIDHYSTAEFGGKFPFHVEIGNNYTLAPAGAVCWCSAHLVPALSSRMPMTLSTCDRRHKFAVPATPFNVPSIVMNTNVFSSVAVSAVLSAASHWENGQFPQFNIRDGEDNLQFCYKDIRTFCDKVGMDRVCIENYNSRFSGTAAEFFALPPP